MVASRTSYENFKHRASRAGEENLGQWAIRVQNVN